MIRHPPRPPLFPYTPLSRSVPGLPSQARRPAAEEPAMTAAYTFDVFCSLDGFGSFNGGDWGGDWGKQGPEFLDRRLASYDEGQRMGLGGHTFQEVLEYLGPGSGWSEGGDRSEERRVGEKGRSR